MYPPEGWDEYQSRRSEIEAAMDLRCYSLPWLDIQILNNHARVFASDDAVIVVTVKQYPAGTTELHGLVAAGSVRGILPLIEQAENWARDAGITFACIASRPGWAPIMKARGYETFQVHIRKEL